MEFQPQKSFFDTIPSKTSFWIGFITAILCLGTLGFILLGTCLLNGDCPTIGGNVKSTANVEDTAPAPTPVAPTATTVAVSKIAAVDKADHIRGDEKAPITIIEYSDYQCPYCEKFHPTMLQVMKDYSGKVRWVFRHFPLSFHPNAEPAAEAAECAGEQGKFWEFTDVMYENISDLGDALYEKTATDLGLNLTKFKECRTSDRMLAVVRADAKEGAAAGVSGTPGSFLIVNGADTAQIIKGALPYASIQAMIDAALKTVK